MKVLLAILLMLSVVGCSTEAKQRLANRVLHVKAHAGKIILQGCDVLDQVDVTVEFIRPYLPDNPEIQAGEFVYDIVSEDVVGHICKRVKDKMEGSKVTS